MSIRRPLYQFAHRILPETFFRHPERWMTQLSASGGQAILSELWRSQDPCYPPAERMEPTGLHYYFERLQSEWRVVVIEFQAPINSSEPYFTAMAWRPAQVLFLILPRRRQASRYFVAERDDDSEYGVIVEWKKDGSYLQHGRLNGPTSADFLNAVEQLTAR